MSDDLPNLGLLIKLMKMTTSSSDGEALTAMRKANEQVAKFGGDWETILKGHITIIGADPFASIPTPPSQRAAPPPRPQPQPFTPPPRQRPQPFTPLWQRNNRAGLCQGGCGDMVDALQGFICKTSLAGGWELYCPAHARVRGCTLAVNPSSKVAQPVPKPGANKWQRKPNPPSLDDLINF